MLDSYFLNQAGRGYQVGVKHVFYPGQSYGYLLPKFQQPKMVTQYPRTSSLASRLYEKEAVALACVWDPRPKGLKKLNRPFPLLKVSSRVHGFSLLLKAPSLYGDLLLARLNASSEWGVWLHGHFKEIRSSSFKLTMEGEFRHLARSVPNTHLSVRKHKYTKKCVSSRGPDSSHFVNHVWDIVLYLSLWS